MVAARLLQARKMRGLTQDALVAALAAQGITLTKQAISKYEIGKSTPPPTTLYALARALGVPATSLISAPTLTVAWQGFRRHSKLKAATRDRVVALAERIAEQQHSLHRLLHPGAPLPMMPRLPAASVNDAEAAAATLRQTWALGDHPIASLTRLIEEHGGVVVACDVDTREFDGLAGWGNDVVPVIVVNTAASPDRRRFTLAHELGHLLLDLADAHGDRHEALANAFAAALLLPAGVVRDALGATRTSIPWEELRVLKQAHGVSMGAWLMRAKTLGVISDRVSQAQWQAYNAQGWRTAEPYPIADTEQPTLLRQMVLRAVAEGLLSEAQGRAIAPDTFPSPAPPPATPPQPAPARSLSVEALWALPAEERQRLVAKAMEMSHNMAFEAFDAYDEDDFDDIADSTHGADDQAWADLAGEVRPH